jgi:methyltransferase
MWLVVMLAITILQRCGELFLSVRNTRRVRARGGREYGARHFPFIVAVHALFPFALLLEVTRLDARPGELWPVWLALWLGAQALRYAAIRALGERWNVRVWVIPGAAPVRSGIYRFLRHPNYVAVTIEFVALPLIFGAWRTAIGISVLGAMVLVPRIRCENAALQRAAVDSSR